MLEKWQVIIMAVLKHIASKNVNYTDSLTYLLFQHDESVKKPILDEQGRMILREEYYLEGLNCDPFLFDEECEKLNNQYHKNQSYREIKSHHYIISFDPNDRDDCGLTGERAQALGMEYASKNFPGHQALVCTHTDGHNGSGNIHVHIVINSLRKLDVKPQPFMERPCDSRAGYKHHLTNDYLVHLKKSLMEICIRENLHQVDLLSPAEVKISEREYWAARKGQLQLDNDNAEILAAGLKPRQTVFQTQKQFLRNAIEDCAASSDSFEDFIKRLYEKYHVIVTDKRGRLSFLHPERNKNISERSLGTRYSKESILKLFGTVRQAPEQTADVSTTPITDYHADSIAVLFIKSDLRLVVDLQNCVKAQQSRAYERAVKVANLKQMANTIIYIQENGFDTMEDLQKSYDEISQKLRESRKEVKDTEGQIRQYNQQIHYTGQYLAHKKTYAQMLNVKNKKAFRSEHESDITLYEEARKYLKSIHPDGKFPSMKILKDEKDKLTIQKDAQYDTYKYFKDYQKELRTVCKNVEAILGKPLVQEQTQEKSTTRD